MKGVPHGPDLAENREFEPLVTDQDRPTDEMRLRAALEIALNQLLSASTQPAGAVLAQAEAELSALLSGRDLRDADAAQLARVIRETIASARRRIYDHNRD